jgi:hypothetical protein
MRDAAINLRALYAKTKRNHATSTLTMLCGAPSTTSPASNYKTLWI